VQGDYFTVVTFYIAVGEAWWGFVGFGECKAPVWMHSIGVILGLRIQQPKAGLDV
jgi:hypothetical protein